VGGDGSAVELGYIRDGARHGGMRRDAVVDGGEVGAVLTGDLHLLHLRPGGSDVTLAGETLLLSGGTRGDAAASVKADAVVDHGVADDRSVDVGGVDDGLVYMDDGGVIGEDATAPLAAGEAVSIIAVAIIDAAVEADVRAPVAGMPAVDAAG
jgi:hypothetical protein